MEHQVLLDLVIQFIALFQGDERVDSLAAELVVDTHDCGFGDLVLNLLAQSVPEEA